MIDGEFTFKKGYCNFNFGDKGSIVETIRCSCCPNSPLVLCKVIDNKNSKYVWVSLNVLENLINQEVLLLVEKKLIVQDGYNPLVPQVAGNHYKDRGIQPIEYTSVNGLSFNQGNVIKYITRYKEKGGIEDLTKVIHYTLLESFFVYGIEGSTELKDRILELLGEVKQC